MKIHVQLPCPLGLMAAAFVSLGAMFPEATMGPNGEVQIPDETRLLDPDNDPEPLYHYLIDRLADVMCDLNLGTDLDHDAWEQRVDNAARIAYVILQGGHRG